MSDPKRMGWATGGLALLAVAGGLWWQESQTVPQPRLQPAVAPLPPRAAAAPPAEAMPRFDVARVGSRGAAVVAGRASPGDEVMLRDRERELGRARADARGEFVILPAEPLPPGAHELSLRARAPDGAERAGEESVLVVVPAGPAPAGTATAGNAAGPQAPLAVLLPAPGASAAPRLLQGAATAGAGAGAAAPAAARLGLDIVDYDEAGGMRFAGTAPPGGTVRVYVDQRHAGDAATDPTGRWALRPAPVPEPGRHTLRVDQLGPAGQVAARLELPFQRDAAAAAGAALAEGRIVVQPGHNLWRIARVTYGRGMRYTVIHQANAGQIRDPARIYPGQIFNLPIP